jgi:hypothetical protein
LNVLLGVFFVRCVWRVESKMDVQNLICTPVSHMHQIYSLKKKSTYNSDGFPCNIGSSPNRSSLPRHA